MSARGMLALLLGFFVFFLWILWRSEGYVGDADSLTHYKFSRYSWLYPEFLLHHWGKPVFTLLNSPFAQFGHAGVSVFNLLAGLASVWMAWSSARHLGYSNTFLLPFFILFAPIYTLLVISGQVEVLFGLFIIAATWLCLEKRFLWAAIIISFSPMVRTEGIIIIPIIALFLMVRQKYWAIPFLLTGFVVYSVVGYFHFNDFFWLINEMPYTGFASEYGKGSLTHFISRAPKIFGWPFVVMAALGSVLMLADWWKDRRGRSLDAILLVLLPFALYFLAHVVMWYTGIGRSLGLHRYMAAIVPVGGLLALRGAGGVIGLFKNQVNGPLLSLAFSILLLLAVVTTPFNQHHIPQRLDGMNKVMKEASDFILDAGLDARKIYYYDPAFFYFLNLNPYDEDRSKPFVYRANEPHYGILPGEIVIWDGHFPPMHGLTLEDLKESPYFETVGVFEPEHPFTIFDTQYRVGVFRRLEDPADGAGDESL